MREIKAVWVRWEEEPIVIEEPVKAGPELIDIRRVQTVDITPRREVRQTPSEKEANRGAWAAAALMVGGMIGLLALWLAVGYVI